MHGRSFRQIDRPGRPKHSVLIDGGNGRHRFAPRAAGGWLSSSAIVSSGSPNSLLTSAFWGGVICINMARHEDFTLPSVLLALTWVGSYLWGSLPLLWMKADVSVSRSAST
jgi:hypothetical protein